MAKMKHLTTGLVVILGLAPVQAAVCEAQAQALCNYASCGATPSEHTARTLQRSMEYLRDRYERADVGVLKDFLLCVINEKSRTQAATDASGDLDTVTPQVPGCPRYLRKSLVSWRRLGSLEWQVTNNSGRTVKVTYRESAGNISPDTLPPRQSVRVSTSAVPPYVVRDFEELMSFDRLNASNDKPLKCYLAIRPR